MIQVIVPTQAVVFSGFLWGDNIISLLSLIEIHFICDIFKSETSKHRWFLSLMAVFGDEDDPAWYEAGILFDYLC